MSSTTVAECQPHDVHCWQREINHRITYAVDRPALTKNSPYRQTRFGIKVAYRCYPTKQDCNTRRVPPASLPTRIASDVQIRRSSCQVHSRRRCSHHGRVRHSDRRCLGFGRDVGPPAQPSLCRDLQRRVGCRDDPVTPPTQYLCCRRDTSPPTCCRPYTNDNTPQHHLLPKHHTIEPP